MTQLHHDERELLQDSMQRFVRERYSFEQRRAGLALPDGVDAAVWSEWAANGWLGLGLSEDCGGYGNPRDLGVAMDAIGAGLVLEPYVPNVVLAGGLLDLLASAGQRSRYLDPLVAGQHRLALALTEAHAPFDPFDWRCIARADGAGGYRLHGRKATVLGGACAQHFIVAARLGDTAAPALFIVPRDAAGLHVTARSFFDGHVGADLELHDVTVPPQAQLGSSAQVLPALTEVLDRGAAALCAEACGAMRHSFDTTLDYLKQRVQFGRPLSQNQALQHRMVDLFNLRREAEAMTAHALQSLDGDDIAERGIAVSAAKVHVGAAAVKLGQECIQLHGAIGTTDDLAVSHYFKRLTAIDLEMGAGRWHARRLQGLLRSGRTATMKPAVKPPLTEAVTA